MIKKLSYCHSRGRNPHYTLLCVYHGLLLNSSLSYNQQLVAAFLNTFTLLGIGLKMAQKKYDSRVEFILHRSGIVLKRHFFRSDTTTLFKRAQTKTERYATLCKLLTVNISLHFRYKFSSFHPALWRIIENSEHFMFWKAFDEQFRCNFYE